MPQTINKRLVFVSILSLAGLIVLGGYTGSGASNQQDEIRPTSQAQAKSGQRVESEVVTITPDGFEPQEIVRPAGPFLLFVTNQSGFDSLNLNLETEARGKLREKSLPLETPYWREVINPPPGRYVITEANHPEWTFSLIIQ